MTLLATERLGINFGGVRAVHDVALRVEPGERRAIIGPNGAGKTTLFNLIGGQLTPSNGSIRFEDQEIVGLSAHRRAYLGIARTFQISKLFLRLTVMENILLAVQGTHPVKLSLFSPLGRQGGHRERATALLEEWGLWEYRDEAVSNLSHGSQRQLEIVLALASGPSLLMLDEPTSGLSIAERELVTERIHGLERDLTILMTEHDMDVVFDVSDRITVLDHGQIVCDGPPGEVRDDPAVHEIYFGGD